MLPAPHVRSSSCLAHLTARIASADVLHQSPTNTNVSGCWQGIDMDAQLITQEAEQILHDAATELMTPKADECLTCYVDRQVGEFGCDGTHRFAESYRDQVAPRATALIGRLINMGACCCECEMFLNAYKPDKKPSIMLSCAGVRRGSTQPCSNWKRISRYT